MTRWLIKCTACGEEREFDAGFNLALLGGRLYIYCRRCRANREHLVSGCLDEEELCSRAGVDVAD